MASSVEKEPSPGGSGLIQPLIYSPSCWLTITVHLRWHSAALKLSTVQQWSSVQCSSEAQYPALLLWLSVRRQLQPQQSAASLSLSFYRKQKVLLSLNIYLKIKISCGSKRQSFSSDILICNCLSALQWDSFMCNSLSAPLSSKDIFHKGSPV